MSTSDSEAELDFDNAADLNQKRRIYQRRPKKAHDLINNIIVKRGIAAEKSDHQLQKNWDVIVGLDIANQTKVGSFRRGVLEVVVAHSSLMQMMAFNKHEYKEKLNQEMQDGVIKDIRFRIGRIS